MTALVHRIILATGWERRLIAMVAGAIGALAMAPFDFFPAMVVPMSVAIWLIDGSQRAKLGTHALETRHPGHGARGGSCGMVARLRLFPGRPLVGGRSFSRGGGSLCLAPADRRARPAVLPCLFHSCGLRICKFPLVFGRRTRPGARRRARSRRVAARPRC